MSGVAAVGAAAELRGEATPEPLVLGRLLWRPEPGGEALVFIRLPAASRCVVSDQQGNVALRWLVLLGRLGLVSV